MRLALRKCICCWLASSQSPVLLCICLRPSRAPAVQVGAAVDSAWSKDEALEKAARAKATSPTQWYVADNLADHTRFFVIQGSETLDHWRVNLTFDPVEFEDPSLGVKVHRGVYAAAEALYDRFLPLVREHLLSSPYAKIVFTVWAPLGLNAWTGRGQCGDHMMVDHNRDGCLPEQPLGLPCSSLQTPAACSNRFQCRARLQIVLHKSCGHARLQPQPSAQALPCQQADQLWVMMSCSLTNKVSLCAGALLGRLPGLPAHAHVRAPQGHPAPQHWARLHFWCPCRLC